MRMLARARRHDARLREADRVRARWNFVVCAVRRLREKLRCRAQRRSLRVMDDTLADDDDSGTPECRVIG